MAPWVGLGAPAILPTVEPEVLVEPVTGASVDNFWHNDILACIRSTGGGGEWRYLVDLPVKLTSHLALFLLLAFWTPCGRVAESHS